MLQLAAPLPPAAFPADSINQSQTAVAQKLLLSCEKGDQGILCDGHRGLRQQDSGDGGGAGRCGQRV
ncbi:hypothetical protein E2562_004248 [Oryza meyeriana var. granulata]|uniref:Uncharacterized protein n=1 Tax=Oryza meyeriana var. granulata TaxID=110450 RepID=A0A6G1BSB6_9ORYZ|nr:hypothetical protein E2562_004248 [Oryza meyeriana var. granulata]